jgi:NAD(P)-dependent dehydrogenase (short-subunit alcohol dehydrogenase family)
MGKVEEMLGIFELLCSEKSDYISGQIIAVDGGFTVW